MIKKDKSKRKFRKELKSRIPLIKKIVRDTNEIKYTIINLEDGNFSVLQANIGKVEVGLYLLDLLDTLIKDSKELRNNINKAF